MPAMGSVAPEKRPVDAPPPQLRAGGTGKPGRKWLVVLVSTLAVVLVGGLSLGSVYAVSVGRSVDTNLQRTNSMPAETPTTPRKQAPSQTGTTSRVDAKPRPAPTENGALNIVLIGADDAAGGASRSDALMVLHLDADRRHAYLISFPRDMYVSIPEHGRNKINAAYAFGGTALTVRTLEGLLETRMDHVAVIDFHGFTELTEELGGVQVATSTRRSSGGFRFPSGDITVSGDEALAYVRQRKELPNGDLDRAERQRAVMLGILTKSLSRETISNPQRFLAFTSGVARHVTVDDALTIKAIRTIALSLRLGPDDVHLLAGTDLRFRRDPQRTEHRHRGHQAAQVDGQRPAARLAGGLRRQATLSHLASQAMEQRVSLVTLGVADLDRSRRFYEALGWQAHPGEEDVVFFQVNGIVVAFWGRTELAEDSAVVDSGGWGGVTLAQNVRTVEEVDQVLALAERAGATIGRAGAPTFWGGHSGIFIDPDGHPWEVAHNPGWTITGDGRTLLVAE